MLATRVPDLAAGMPFYGAAPPAHEVAAIKAPLLIVFADSDERINAMWPAHEAAKYPGTQHGFNNDTTPRNDASAARAAWERTIALFDRTLRA